MIPQMTVTISRQKANVVNATRYNDIFDTSVLIMDIRTQDFPEDFHHRDAKLIIQI